MLFALAGEEEGKGGRATKEDAGEKEWATGRKREKRRDLTGINWIQKLARTSTILISPAKKITNGEEQMHQPNSNHTKSRTID